MVVDGKLVFTAGSTFSVDDGDAMVRGGVVVATATGGVQGRPAAAPGSEKWMVVVEGNDVVLQPKIGFIILVR